MKNTTSESMGLDLLREEIQILIFITISVELKLIINYIQSYSTKKVDKDLFVDAIIKFLLVRSKRKILSRLGLNTYGTLEISNQWIIKKIQIEEYSSVLNLLDSMYSTRNTNSYNLTASLIENLVIKLSDFMVYEVFSNKNILKFIFLKWYTVDYLLFSYSLANLKTYLYWKSYVEVTYSNIKRFSTDTYPLLICTKNGIESKRLYSRSLIDNTKSSKIQALFSKSLNFMEYLFYKTKLGM